MFRRLIYRQPNLILALLALTLAIRVIVPSGYMPSTGADGMIRVSVCTGMGATDVWIDHDGKIHKEAPTSDHHAQQPCGFGVLGLGLDVASAAILPMPAFADDSVTVVAGQTFSIGHGLAAPPPPSTGPPSLI
jgi:hypothetical protein